MSKRLKLVTGSESEMEERSFPNPFPDWDPGVLTSSPSAANSSTGDTFDANGKVSHAVFLFFFAEVNSYFHSGPASLC